MCQRGGPNVGGHVPVAATIATSVIANRAKAISSGRRLRRRRETTCPSGEGSAIEDHDRAVEVGVPCRGHPGDELPALLRLADSTERARLEVAFLMVLRDRGAQSALEDAGRDAVDEDAVRPELVGQAAGHPLERPLARRVVD